jgi:hypothetical protein
LRIPTRNGRIITWINIINNEIIVSRHDKPSSSTELKQSPHIRQLYSEQDGNSGDRNGNEIHKNDNSSNIVVTSGYVVHACEILPELMSA